MTEQLETEEPSPFMTPEQTVEYLRLGNTVRGVRTLAAWRCAGTGPPFRKHGRAVVYHVVDIDTWSEQQRRSSTGEKATA